MERTFGIGIDLGTSNSAVCRLETGSGRYEFAHAMDLAGNRDIPSAVYIDTDGGWYFGQAAEQRQQTALEADRVISNFKLLLRANAPLDVPGIGEVDPVQLVHRFVAYLKQCYETRFQMPCERAVITVPAHSEFDADYRERVRQAVQESGFGPLFESVSTLEEPDAVLMSLIDLEPFYDSTVLVFDMGGGTLDVTIRQVDGSGDRPVLHHAAVTGSNAAGVQVTRALTNHVLTRWEQRAGFSFTVAEREAAARTNHFSIDQAKRHLSGLAELGGLDSTQTYNCRVNYPGRGEGYFADYIAAKVLTDLSRPTCETALATVQEALDEAGLVSGDIDHYFMVGGSSMLPLMRTMMKDFFGGRDPNPSMGSYGDIDPLLSVSKGAALYDFQRHEEARNVPSTVPVLERRLPYAVSLLVDIDRVECLVPEGSPLPFGPVSRTRYMPVDDDNVDIVMLRGEGNLQDCAPMAHRTVFFDGVRRRGSEFEITWFVDEDGGVTVTILGTDGEPIEAITASRLTDAAA